MEFDVALELEAMEAVYLDDCRILQRQPPHVEIFLKPRTADVLALQFVEVLLSIKATDKYPSESPKFELVLAKGLDEERQANLLAALESGANELSNEPMLITLSESGIEFLTANNYPEGDCCFCLFPLVDPTIHHTQQQEHYMKLMSCFHCFHCVCFSTWWKWLPQDTRARCPICRADIHREDVAHVKDIDVQAPMVESGLAATEVALDDQVIGDSTSASSSDQTDWTPMVGHLEPARTRWPKKVWLRRSAAAGLS